LNSGQQHVSAISVVIFRDVKTKIQTYINMQKFDIQRTVHRDIFL